MTEEHELDLPVVGDQLYGIGPNASTENGLDPVFFWSGPNSSGAKSVHKPVNDALFLTPETIDNLKQQALAEIAVEASPDPQQLRIVGLLDQVADILRARQQIDVA